jgi:NADH:ubiquinone oxidoreductase subunit K
MHNFSLVGEVFLYFTLRVEVVEIQISLQIINRFGKRKKEFSILTLVVGRNLAGSRA